MLMALTHVPSPALQQCELTFMEAQRIHAERAATQHQAYCATLQRCGATVVTLDGNREQPDGVFVEDNLVVLDDIAVATPMGAATRRPEVELLAQTISQYRPVHYLADPAATLEGGDVLRMGTTLFVGLSTRTNAAGIAALRDVIAPHGYSVVAVPVHGCLHLKTGCTALDDATVLLNPAWIDTTPLQQFTQVAVEASEPFAPNVLRIGDTIVAHAGFPLTNATLSARGYHVVTTDISEFTKAEAGLTCMSVLFHTT